MLDKKGVTVTLTRALMDRKKASLLTAKGSHVPAGLGYPLFTLTPAGMSTSKEGICASSIASTSTTPAKAHIFIRLNKVT